MQWASFARPTSAADQVASLLGVVPVVDAGQPTRLALAAPVPVTPAAPERVETASAEPAPATAPAPAPEPVVAEVRPVVPAVVPVPVTAKPAVVAAVRPSLAPAAKPVAAAHASAAGKWFVQFGAYENASVAHEGWSGVLRRDAAIRAHAPLGASVTTRTGQFYRLSVGGFARGDADAMCRAFRRHGGACFVRAGAGEQVASWVRHDVQVAAR